MRRTRNTEYGFKYNTLYVEAWLLPVLFLIGGVIGIVSTTLYLKSTKPVEPDREEIRKEVDNKEKARAIGKELGKENFQKAMKGETQFFHK